MTTLVFPASTPAALEYLKLARGRGESVIAASSVVDHSAREAFGEWTLLPYVYDPDFPKLFCDLVRANSVTDVYAPVASVHAFLDDFIAREHLSVKMIGASPSVQAIDQYRSLLERAKSALSFIDTCAGGSGAGLSVLDVAAIFRTSASIYGESNEEKIMAMMAVFASAPRGDVIEIGSLLGKSAFVLQYLAQRRKVGAVLSVDPLSADSCVQYDSPEIVRTRLIKEWDFEIMRAAFAINTLPTAGGQFNYLRRESEQGFEQYCSSRTVTSSEFGSVNYVGDIAVIHIDGNHDYKQVKKDCDLWLRRLLPGAWVILDDYVWTHGNGPQRAGDELLDAHRSEIDLSFVCGKALFMKVSRALA